MAFLDDVRDAARGFPAALWSESTGQPAGYSVPSKQVGWRCSEAHPSAARMLSVLLGAASLVAFYVMCQVVFDRRAALFATLMLSHSAHGIVWYSTQRAAHGGDSSSCSSWGSPRCWLAWAGPNGLALAAGYSRSPP